MAPHTGSATPEQIDTLLSFLDDHKDLARGKLRSIEGKLHAKRLWEDLCNTLNSMGGCTKTVQQWQKVWFDRKHLAKKAAAEARRSASMTGGGPLLVPQLSQWELKVLSIMGNGFGGRQTESRVPAFIETNNEPVPSTSRQVEQTPSYSQSLSLMNLPEEVFGHVEPSQESVPTQLLQPASQPVPQESFTSRSSQPVKKRRRQSAATDSVRSRLYQFEEERAEREIIRNSELAGIRSELAGLRADLSQLFGLIREMITKN